MSTIPGGKVVSGKIASQKHAPSPHDRDNPQASPRPEGRAPYQAAAKQQDNYAPRTAEMKAHRETLSEPRTDR
jgi:hypothetical protein